MPARSQAQRAYLNAKFGHDWVKAHDFDNKGKLPKHTKKKTKGRKQSREQIASRQRMAQAFQRRNGGRTKR